MSTRTITDPNSEDILQPGEELDLVYEVLGDPSDWWLGQYTGYVERKLEKEHPELDYLGFSVSVDGKTLTFKFRQRSTNRTDTALPVQQASVGSIVAWLAVAAVGVAAAAVVGRNLRFKTAMVIESTAKIIANSGDTFKRLGDDAVLVVAGIIVVILLLWWK